MTAAHHLTRWHSVDVEPQREGVYQTQVAGATRPLFPQYSYWHGDRIGWGISEDSPLGAFARRSVIVTLRKRWRGLTYHEYRRQGGK